MHRDKHVGFFVYRDTGKQMENETETGLLHGDMMSIES